MNKILNLIPNGELLTYWHQGQQNNYASVKRACGVVKFPAVELAKFKEVAAKRGYELVVGGNGSGPAKPTPTQPEQARLPEGAIDKALGVLKTVSGEWVVNCVTGRLINKRDARFIGVSSRDGYPYWIEKDASINDGPVAHPSVFGPEKPKPRNLNLIPRRLSSLVSGL